MNNLIGIGLAIGIVGLGWAYVYGMVKQRGKIVLNPEEWIVTKSHTEKLENVFMIGDVPQINHIEVTVADEYQRKQK